jgi:hypothetical protein
MSLKDELDERLKVALKARDQRVAGVLRMVKARLMERVKAADFKGEEDDALVIATITAYSKQLSKAIPEFERAGAKGADEIARLQFEIDYLSPWVPSKLDEAATRPLVAAVIAELGATDPRQVGRVIGAVMKAHGEQADPQVVKAVAQELLGG